MKRHKWDRIHVESIVGVRKIISVEQTQHRRGVTTYISKPFKKDRQMATQKGLNH